MDLLAALAACELGVRVLGLRTFPPGQGAEAVPFAFLGVWTSLQFGSAHEASLG